MTHVGADSNSLPLPLIQELARQSDLVFWLVELHPERIVYVSPAFERLWGCRAEELYRDPRLWTAPIDPEDRPAVIHAFEETLAGRRATFEIEYRIPSAEGGVRWILDQGWPIRDATGMIRRVCGMARDVSVRRRIEAALVESEERYRSVIESLSEGVVVADPAGNIRACNPSAERILGLSRAGLIGLSAVSADWQTVHEDGRVFTPDEFPIVHTLRTGEACADIIMGVKRPNGELRWITINTEPVRLPGSSEPRGAVASFQDITDRKLQLDDTYRTNQLLQAIIDSSPEAIMVIDRQTRVKVWNAAAEDIFGWRAEEVLDQPLPIVPPDQQADFDEMMQRQFEDRVTYRGKELIRQKRDGTLIDARLSTAVLRDKQGVQQAVMGVISDITAGKRAESLLRESEQRFRQLADNLDDSFWLIDWPFTRVLYISPGFEKLWGRSCQSVIENPDSWVDSMLPEDRERVLEAFARDAPRGDYDVRFRIVRPDGEIRWVRDRAFPIRDAQGNVVRLAGISADITLRHRYQEELRQRDAELAHLSRVSAMGEMAAQLAHEINQPLYAIANYAEACKAELNRRDKTSSKELGKSIASIARLAQRAGEIMKRIQQFVRRHEVDFQATDANEMVREVAQLLESTARQEQVRVEYKLREHLPKVRCDRILVEQVLLNLMRNAIEAMGDIKPKQRRLTVSTSRAGKTSIRFSVTDTGRGLPAGDVQRLFEPFVTTRQDGLGMGLAICRSTILAHEGTIDGRNNPDQGATFSFTLPVFRRMKKDG